MQQFEDSPLRHGTSLRYGGAHAEEAGRQLQEHVRRAEAAEESTQKAQCEADELRQQVPNHMQP